MDTVTVTVTVFTKVVIKKTKVAQVALRVNLNLAPSIPSTQRGDRIKPTNNQQKSPLLRGPLHANLTPASSMPLTSPTTSSSSMAHERVSSTLLKVVAFASRSFTSPFTVFSGFRPT